MFKYVVLVLVVVVAAGGGGFYANSVWQNTANQNATLKATVTDLSVTVKELQKQLREQPAPPDPDTNGQAAAGATETVAPEAPVSAGAEAGKADAAKVLPASAAFAPEVPAPTTPVTDAKATPIKGAAEAAAPATTPAPATPAPALNATGDVLPLASSAPAAQPEQELSFALPVLGELPAVVRNGKTILPAVTPQFLANVPVASGDLRGSGVIDYDPNERGVVFEQIVRHNQVAGDVLETRVQGYGKPRHGDENFLFNRGRLFFGQTDTNGHYEGSPSNGVSFNKPQRVVGGYGVFVTGYRVTRRESGKKVRVALNIIYVMREGAVVLRNPDVWNLREFFVAGNEGFVGMTDEELYLNEAQSFAAANNDRSYFAVIAVPKGGVVDPVADRDRLLKENGFHSFSDDLPFDFVAAK
jgi:hypothetical protein